MLKDVFGFAEGPEKATNDLGYKSTLTRNKGDAVLNKAEAIADARNKIDHIHWHVPYYTLSIPQQGILSEQILRKRPTEIRYIEQSVFMKEVNTKNLWNYELGSQKSMNVPICIIIGFQRPKRQDTQNLNNDTFCRLPVTSAQCIIAAEKYPDGSILLSFDDDDYSQSYRQIEEVFRAVTKDDILKFLEL